MYDVFLAGDCKGNLYVLSSVVVVTLCCDHRVVDGAVGAAWLSHFRRFVEDPVLLML